MKGSQKEIAAMQLKVFISRKIDDKNTSRFWKEIFLSQRLRLLSTDVYMTSSPPVVMGFSACGRQAAFCGTRWRDSRYEQKIRQLYAAMINQIQISALETIAVVIQHIPTQRLVPIETMQRKLCWGETNERIFQGSQEVKAFTIKSHDFGNVH